MTNYAYETIPAVTRRRAGGSNGHERIEKQCPKCERWLCVTSGGFSRHYTKCKAQPMPALPPVMPAVAMSPVSAGQSPNATLLAAIVAEVRETNRLLAALLAVWTTPKDDLA